MTSGHVRVAGGDLAVRVTGTGPSVLAVHGITASQRAWDALARALPDVRLLAPDLRGRGRSRDLPGPYGLRRHADDLAQLLAALAPAAVPVVGHSMGAFVAVTLAARHPERVDALVLVDGGVPLPRPDGVDDARLPAIVLGPALERLRRRFPDAEAYHDFWRRHPAFADVRDDDLVTYADHDLVDDGEAFRPAPVEDAVSADALELYGPAWYREAIATLDVPVTILRAPRDLQDRPGGLYPAGSLEAAVSGLRRVEIVEVADVNHYSILMSPRGADAVAAAVRPHLSPTPAKEPA